MKKLIYIITIFLILGCESNNSTIKLLKSNTKSYQNLKNTKEITIRSALIYVRFNHQTNNFIVSINSKDRDSNVGLNKCLVNNHKSKILPTNQKAINGISWLDNYEVTTTSASKRLKLECSLTNQDSFEVTFEF